MGTPAAAAVEDRAKAGFVYDADGQRMKTVEPGGKTTYYPFPGYEEEVNGSTTTRRTTYSLGGQAVALRVQIVGGSNTYYYLHNDHLGSNRLMTTSSGINDGVAVAGSTARYYPFGDWRTEPTANLTDRGFTGHLSNNLGNGADDLGLIYMNARYYVPNTNRMVSPDTIVPDPTNPQSFNRYSYVRNNPVNFTDPTGHSECGVGQYHCEGDTVIPSSPISDAGLFKMIAGAFTRVATVEAIKLGYDHYLPHELIEHYAYGSNGESFHLSESDMAELGVYINLNENDVFNDLVNQMSKNGGGTTHVSFSSFEIASTHGTLGVFTANYEGELTIFTDETGNRSGWAFVGSVNFFDTWDFDPRPWGERQTTYAEVLTRVGNTFLPGESFDITSDSTPVSQLSTQTEAAWVGQGIQGQLSNLAIDLGQ